MTYTKTGLTTGEIYQWKVVAANTLGRSPASSALVVIAAVIPEAPAVPTSSFADETSITIDWTPPSDGGSALTKYII